MPLSDAIPRDDPLTLSRLLSNGRYRAMLTGTGSGFSGCEDFALTRPSEDWLADDGGLFIYLRDLDRDRLWSAGLQPVLAAPERYEVSVRADCVSIVRLDYGLETQLDVRVASDADLEIRRLLLTNHGGARRRLEVTTYAELVLADPEAYAAHPAFSKLFVQTEYAAEQKALLATRRQRGGSEAPVWAGSALVGPGTMSYETDRARFLGRGGSVRAPRALTSGGALSGTAGSVLDPVFSLQRTVEIEPGESVEWFLLLGLAKTRETALALLARFASPAARAVMFPARADEAAATPVRVQEPRNLVPSAGRFRPAAEERRSVNGYSSPGERGSETGALVAYNGCGGFSPDGTEYVIHLTSGADLPPMPWVNVVANETFGFLVSETGAGNTWGRNSRQNRLTPWHNDPITDPHDEALYVRDEDARIFWSPLPGPLRRAGFHEVRHGFGYSRWRHVSCELDHEVCFFVPRSDPIKIMELRLTNRSDRVRRLSIFSYQRLTLGAPRLKSGRLVSAYFDPDPGAIFAHNRERGEFSDGVVFSAAVVPPGASVHFTCDCGSFIGWRRSTSFPVALTDGERLDGEAGSGTDPCAAFQVTLAVAPRGTVELAFLLGEAAGETTAPELIARYRQPDAISRALSDVREFWRELVSTVQVETPAPAIDIMVNGWLPYQALSCRLWGRSAFYQSGGAFGFRDQLQDSAGMIYLRPDLTRAQILLHAAHQFTEGDVLHWWHPPLGSGTRTRFSDDLVWLPLITAFYVHTTGDWSVLDEIAPFLHARALAPGEDEAYLLPEPSGESADIYTHCCRAFDRSLTKGAHGLPLMGTGDWNDGMNRVGRGGRGESVWMGFFLYYALEEFLPLCRHRSDGERAGRYSRYRENLGAALNDAGWDGEWYRRAYYDDGTPLGSAENDECRIDALAQAWAVISGAAPPERAQKAMDAVERHLISERDGLIRLLTPPFDRTARDPGYIKGYVPGIRENGGQYTHAALWIVRALAELGRRDRAATLLEMLSPVSHADTAEKVATYKVEPYVVAADIYGVEPHVGRGGWTWYTGSAAWMYRVALESVLGFTIRGGNKLRIRPCVPNRWPGFRILYRLPDGKTRYEIEVRNPNRNAATVTAFTVDGENGAVEDGAAIVRLHTDGAQHRVSVILGEPTLPALH